MTRAIARALTIALRDGQTTMSASTCVTACVQRNASMTSVR